MPSNLQTTTPTLSFGQVVTGNTYDLTCTVVNYGDEPCDVSEVIVDSPYSTPGIVLTHVVEPLGSFSFTVRFTAGAVGVTTPDNMLIVSTDPGSPIPIDLTSESIAAGTKAISVNPSSFAFADTKVGVDSAIQVFVVTNTGTVNVGVTGATFPGGFAAATPIPAYTVTLTPGQTMSLGVKFHPLGQGFAMGNVAIASDAAAGDLNIAVSGIGFLITPAFIATGTQVLLAAFGNTVLQFDPADFDCEEDCTLTRDLSLYAPGYQASLMRVQLNTEAKGLATLNIAVTNRHGQTSDDDVVLSTATDDSIKAAFGNLSVTDEVLRVVFTRSADDGPVSITGYIYNFTPAGEVVPVTP